MPVAPPTYLSEQPVKESKLPNVICLLPGDSERTNTYTLPAVYLAYLDLTLPATKDNKP
jgi:hypothetical protein